MKYAVILLCASILFAQTPQDPSNPYVKKRSHETTTHTIPVPKYQLLPPITLKKSKPKPKYKTIIDEDGKEILVDENNKPITREELTILEAKQRCLDEDGAWCWKLGIYYYEGKIVEQDYNKAFEAFEAGCLKKSGGACYNIGFMYEFGRGEVPFDSKKALDFYLKSCNYGYDRGCQAYRAMK
ncbi:hypothetical protein BBW65_02025 [Helicobacter enhydrae]|uniref:Beta-lactamase n=1 Tax=Helicobacter enhydrae TaxID=222136 RepID=A0A1B1U4E8_9HELI|nr:tetratricopeptide repeat protein [Helicobacter enhydrae]ANV97657.1 hypothetical protein BBW65_02025 [Helicobacter enhydrae]